MQEKVGDVQPGYKMLQVASSQSVGWLWVDGSVSPCEKGHQRLTRLKMAEGWMRVALCGCVDVCVVCSPVRRV